MKTDIKKLKTGRQIDLQKYKQRDRKTDRNTSRQKDRRKDRQEVQQTDRPVAVFWILKSKA